MANIFRRIKKFFYQIFNRLRHARKRVILWALFVVIVLTAGFAFFVSQTSPQTRAAIIRDNPLVPKLLPIYWSLRKISDILYLPYFFKKNSLPAYELVISQKNLDKLNESLPKEFSNTFLYDKISVPAEFRFAGKTYSVKVRYRGDNAIHWNAPKRSYAVEFDKDDPFSGMSKLNFIIPDDRNFVLEHFNNFRAGQLGLLYPESGFANLKINGRMQGLYFLSKGWSAEMLAKWEVPDESNFYAEEDRPPRAGTVSNYRVWNNSDGWQKLVSDSQLGYGHYSEIYKLVELLNNSSDEEFYHSIFNLVDKDNFYSWQIHQELVNSTHQAFYNIRLYFNNTSGKFYFIPWDVEITPAALNNIDFYGTLARRIFSNPQYLREKNQRLYAYVADEANRKRDLDFYDKTYQEIKTALYQDRLKIYTNRWADKITAANRQEIINNLDAIKNRLELNSVFVDAGISDNLVQKFGGENVLAYFDFNVKSPSGLLLAEVKPQFKGDFRVDNLKLYYDSNSNDQLDPKDQPVADPAEIFLHINRRLNAETGQLDLTLTRHRFYLTSATASSSDFSDNLVKIAFNVKNAVSGRELNGDEISVKLENIGLFQHFDDITAVEKFQKENPIFQVDRARKEIFLPSGDYEISRTVVVPAGFSLKILPATTLRFYPGVSLISYSSVSAVGTADRPIVVSARDSGRPWGVFAVVNSPFASRFSFVRFSGGKDDYLNGIYFSGTLSIYYSDVVIDHSEIRGAQADDGLNVKSAKAEIVSSKFVGNSADGIDFDFIKSGRVADSEFSSNGNDGLDLSGSTVLVSDNYFEKSGDKCISVGEKSLETVVYNNVLNGCNIGIEIKDLSDIAIVNNVIINNKIGVNAYRKKPFFGGGRAAVYNSIIWNNGTSVRADEFSEINLFNSDYPGAGEKDGNLSEAPIFSDPANRNYTLSAGLENRRLREGGNAAFLKAKLNLDRQKAPVGLNQ